MKLNEAIRQLRQVNIPVPKPMRLPTEAEVNNAEKQLGVKFLPDYRSFLLQASDVVFGTLEPATVTPNSGHTELISLVTAAWDQMGVSKTLCPICEDNGNYFCMTESGEVVYWSHDNNGLTDEKWDDIASWIEQVWLKS